MIVHICVFLIINCLFVLYYSILLTCIGTIIFLFFVFGLLVLVLVLYSDY
ncbi:hypothetical protein Leryth_021227 [Lithospermum erythrorhizon]|nr:hypothetical protein Leryth_021227 [Lithospermum erythrorhizon]